MSEIRFQSSDPGRAPRTFLIDARFGLSLAALLTLLGATSVLGLFGAPDLISDLERSADTLALRETARRGQEALDSVSRRLQNLARRLAADELFLARIASIAGVPLPPGFPADPPDGRAMDPDSALARCARRVRVFEAFRRRVGSATRPSPGLEPGHIPSRSPVEPTIAVLVTPYGLQPSPVARETEFQVGIDLAAPLGAAVVASAEGVVLYRGTVPSKAGALWRRLGNVVVLAHGERIRTVYGHLGKILVSPKGRVRRGDPIGQVGQSGFAAGPRLHYEVRRLGAGGRFVPVDPRLHILDVDLITAEEVRHPPVPPADADLPPGLR